MVCLIFACFEIASLWLCVPLSWRGWFGREAMGSFELCSPCPNCVGGACEHRLYDSKHSSFEEWQGWITSRCSHLEFLPYIPARMSVLLRLHWSISGCIQQEAWDTLSNGHPKLLPAGCVILPRNITFVCVSDTQHKQHNLDFRLNLNVAWRMKKA